MQTKAIGRWLGASVATLAVIGAAAAQVSEPKEPVMFVVDGSNSMWGQLDGVPKIDLTKQAFDALLPKLDEGQPVGLVLYGHREKASCGDIELVSPPATGNRASLKASVNAVSPRGKTPITQALKTAADALPNGGNGTIVLLSDGVETCQADPCAMAQTLKARNINFTVNVIGVDIRKPSDKASLACIAESTGGIFTDVDAPDALETALRESAETTGSADVATPVHYELQAVDGMEGPVISDAVFEIMSASDESVIASDVRDGYDFMPGDYVIVARSGMRSGALETRILKDDTARTVTVVVNSVLPEAALDFENPVPAASVLSVSWSGPDAEGDYIELLDGNGDRLEDSYFVYTADGNPSQLRVPGEEGAYSLRYVYARANAPLAEAPLTVTPALASLSATAEAEVGTSVDVSWTGPAGEGDLIGVFPNGASEEDRSPLSYERVIEGSPLSLHMPGAEGYYEIRYLTGNDMTVLAATPIHLTPAAGAIEAPASVAMGETVRIALSGSFNAERDYVTIVPADAGASAYDESKYTDGSGPVLLRTPAGTGAYEIRIVREAGDANQVLFRKAIAIAPPVATLSAPATAAPGEVINVVATGPVRREGDDDVYIAITAPDEGAGAYSGGYEYVDTSGETVAIAAPDTPGIYELRYVAKSRDFMVLARQPLTVQ